MPGNVRWSVYPCIIHLQHFDAILKDRCSRWRRGRSMRGRKSRQQCLLYRSNVYVSVSWIPLGNQRSYRRLITGENNAKIKCWAKEVCLNTHVLSLLATLAISLSKCLIVVVLSSTLLRLTICSQRDANAFTSFARSLNPSTTSCAFFVSASNV